MSDPIRDYQDALRAYTKAQQDAHKVIGLITAVEAAITRNIEHFLAAQYGAPVQASQIQRGGAVDMAQWPDATALKLSLMGWFGAFQNVHHTWGQLPPNDRVGLVSPPQKLGPS